MLAYPQIDPVIVHIGPLALRWYGLMYLVGFGAGYFLVKRQILEGSFGASSGVAPSDGGPSRLLDQLDGLLLACALGLILGARLGYAFFYNLPYYLDHPAEILATWHGGMSFHGGFIGAVLASLYYCRRHRMGFWEWADRLCVTAPVGLGFGRVGNFINGELYGRASDVPWAMVFPEGGPVARHPSQLYEAFLEGAVLFAVLWPLRRRPWPAGRKFALFLVLYAVCRIIVEFFREPDPQLSYLLWGWLTMGQVLSAALLAAGAVLWAARGPDTP